MDPQTTCDGLDSLECKKREKPPSKECLQPFFMARCHKKQLNILVPRNGGTFRSALANQVVAQPRAQRLNPKAELEPFIEGFREGVFLFSRKEIVFGCSSDSRVRS